MTAGALVVSLMVVGISYGRALAYPGAASLAVRTVDWVRDHGGAPVVDVAENWWYSYLWDTANARLAADSRGATMSVPAALRALNPHPNARDGEGVWQALPTGHDGAQVGYATFLHPDPDHPKVLAGIARFDQRLVSTQLLRGTREPILDPTPGGGQVPAAIRARLVATFNSGYKSTDSQGGFYTDHHLLGALRDGAASVVIDDAGRLTVAQWGRDAHLGPHIAAVRQNLALIVDDGHPVSGLEANRDQQWGRAGTELQYTWRSAIGTDAAEDLFYVAGNQLTLPALARALSATGAVRGMQLDIHPNMVNLYTYRHDKGTAEPIPSKLLDTMGAPPDRYLVADRRDFFAMTRR